MSGFFSPVGELICQPVGQSLLIYDPAQTRAFELSGPARACFEACQQGQLEQPNEVEQAILADLAQLGLLVGPPTSPDPGRRALLAAAGVAVASVLAPLPALAQSLITDDECEAGGFCGTLCDGIFGTRTCGPSATDPDCRCRAAADLDLTSCPCTPV